MSRLPKYAAKVQSDQDEHCVLSHECTRCVNGPNNLVTFDWCLNDKEEKGDLKTTSQECYTVNHEITKDQHVKICNPVFEKECPQETCDNCPLFCQPQKQVWCEDTFQVRPFYILTFLSSKTLALLAFESLIKSAEVHTAPRLKWLCPLPRLHIVAGVTEVTQPIFSENDQNRTGNYLRGRQPHKM